MLKLISAEEALVRVILGYPFTRNPSSESRYFASVKKEGQEFNIYF